MTATHLAFPSTTSHPGTAILWAGLLAGAMDITAALVIYGAMGARPIRLLQGIAAGLLGPRSYSGGLATAALGLLCHFVIAYGAAATYVAASRSLTFLVRNPFAAGPLYGIAVYFFMQGVVRLSAAAHRPFSWKMTLIGCAIHIVCIGTPIALVTRHFTASPRP